MGPPVRFSMTTSRVPLLNRSPTASPRLDLRNSHGRTGVGADFFEGTVALIPKDQLGLSIGGAELYVIDLRVDVTVDENEIVRA